MSARTDQPASNDSQPLDGLTDQLRATVKVRNEAQEIADEAGARVRGLVLEAKQAGLSNPAIAEILGVSRQRVYEILRDSQPLDGPDA